MITNFKANMSEIASKSGRIMHNLVGLMDEIFAAELTQGEMVELVEYATVEQNRWVIDSVGYNLLEAFKSYVRVYEEFGKTE